LTKVFASSTGINEDVDKEIVAFRSLFEDGPRNRSRKRWKEIGIDSIYVSFFLFFFVNSSTHHVSNMHANKLGRYVRRRRRRRERKGAVVVITIMGRR
jgi:hypothetical protein